MKTLTCKALKERIDNKEDFVLLDVREPHEHDFARIEYQDNPLISVGELDYEYKQLDPNKDYVIYCRSGMRSAQACELLEEKGFKTTANLIGGINQWAQDIDPSIPQY